MRLQLYIFFNLPPLPLVHSQMPSLLVGKICVVLALVMCCRNEQLFLLAKALPQFQLALCVELWMLNEVAEYVPILDRCHP